RIGGTTMARIIIPITLTDSDLARFLKYLRRDELTDCLLWTARRRRGYGTFGIKASGKWRPIFAHRVAFVLGGGVLTPERPFVLHHCDNPPCCEFTHLWAG